MVVPIHPNFRMISAGNTPGDGKSDQYLRGKIDEAVMERMTPKKFYYDNKVESRILQNWLDSWYDVFCSFRAVCDDYARQKKLVNAPGIITTRDASAIAKYIKHNSKPLEQVIREKFTQVKNNEYLDFILNGMMKRYPSITDKTIDLSVHKPLGEYNKLELAQKLIYTCNRVIEETKAKNASKEEVDAATKVKK